MKRYNAHKWVQTTSVAPGLPRKLGETYYAVAVGHGLLGLAAVVFGVLVMLRGYGLVPRAQVLELQNLRRSGGVRRRVPLGC